MRGLHGNEVNILGNGKEMDGELTVTTEGPRCRNTGISISAKTDPGSGETLWHRHVRWLLKLMFWSIGKKNIFPSHLRFMTEASIITDGLTREKHT
jgi:hypothetical protein